MFQVFRDYDFEDGGYSLFFKNMRGRTDFEFEISEKELLVEIKKEWNFLENDSIGRCWYDYYMEVRRNGEKVSSYLMCFICKRLIKEKSNPVELFEIDPTFIQKYIDQFLIQKSL